MTGAQVRISAMLAGVAALTFAVSAIAAHATTVIEDHVQRQIARHSATKWSFFYHGGYFDDGDYLLMEQLPNADFSQGGVYFIGASEMRQTLMPWRLSDTEARLIHNFSIGDARHRDVRQYLRMLVEEAGLLQAGPERTTIFLGLSTEMTRAPSGHYVHALFERHGLYSYEWSGPIHIRDLSPIERGYRVARADANRFLRFFFLNPNYVGRRRSFEQRPDMQVRTGDWRPVMEEEVAELAATVDYLQALGVRVHAIYPPQASWRKNMDYTLAYQELVLPMLAERNVLVIDQRDLLEDGEFSDAVHALYDGQVKLHNAYVELGREALREMGLTTAALSSTSSRE